MLFVGSQRGGAAGLSQHLLSEANDHVEVHSVSGFCSDTLTGALNEAYALSRGTRCKQFLYSLSINPPDNEIVATADFLSAIEDVETRLGLSGQPRAIVFHEKEGRRHAHAVWSRIDTGVMKAVNIAFPKRKLMQLSRELYRKHEWTMPEGFADSAKRDPKNFTRKEYERAKRTGMDIRAVKRAFSDAWAISDSRAGFIHALEERGFVLANGRRGFVGVDHTGEVYAVARQTKIKTKLVRERLGDPEDLPSIDEVRARIANDMIGALNRYKAEIKKDDRAHYAAFEQRKAELVQRQRVEREALNDKIELRRVAETKTRQVRFRGGIKGLWDSLRGRNKRIRRQNEREAEAAEKRDVAEKDALVFTHQHQRRRLVVFRLRERKEARSQLRELRRDIQSYRAMRSRPEQKTDTPRRRGPSPDP